MGGERASTTRQRESGKICCICGILLSAPLPAGYKPGPRTGERRCDLCSPPIRVLLHTHKYGSWGVHFLEADCRARIGPWLLFDTLDEVRAIVRWGKATDEDVQDFEAGLRAWGVGDVWLSLSRLQRASLIARGRGWPWNGYELQKMKDAGRYPPRRLTPDQERDFIRRHRTERKPAP